MNRDVYTIRTQILTVKLSVMDNLIGFLEKFSTEKKCLKHLVNKRFASKIYCPRCNHDKIYRFKDGVTYKCAKCRRKFNAKTGTIFHGTKLGLKKWFIAIYLFSSSKKGISSVHLSTLLGLTQKTAWFMLHRIRQTFLQKTNKLFGDIEIDECYLGGVEKNKHQKYRIKGNQGRSTITKTAIVGIVQRELEGEEKKKKKNRKKGEIRIISTKNVSKKIITKFIKKNLDDSASLIADDYYLYNGLSTRRVNHSENCYVIGEDHTNSVESLWALIKRGYKGTYHWISRKHMQRYLDEFATRLTLYRSKLSTYSIFEYCIKNISNKLTYKQLIYD